MSTKRSLAPASVWYQPTAVQSPSAGQSISWTWAPTACSFEFTSPPPVLSAAVPGTSSACTQVPALSSTTKAWGASSASLYVPPAAQFPGEEHATVPTSELPPWLSAASPGTRVACPQVPPTSAAR